MALATVIGALFTLLAASGGDAQPSAVEVFREACMAGTVRIPSKDVRPIGRRALVRPVRYALSAWPGHLASDAEIYELALPEGDAFLVVGTGTSNRYCSVASQHIRYWDARVAVDQRPQYLAKISTSARRRMERMGHHHTISSLGYRVEIRRVDEGFIVMTTLLPKEKVAKQ